MGLPRITYNSKTINFTKREMDCDFTVGPPRTVNIAVSGTFEVIRLPRVDINVRVRFRPINDAALAASLESFWQWAIQGNTFVVMLDTDYAVNTTITGSVSAGATAVVVSSATGITQGRTYKLIDGPNYQLVTVSSISGGTTINFTSTALNFAFGAGAKFRDPFYFPGVIQDEGAPYPVRYLAADSRDPQSFPLSKFEFNLEFMEDIR